MSDPQGSYPNEQGRWMLVFGIPMLVACIFLATTLGTSIRWLLGFCLVFGPGVGVVSLVYLALSSDTNDGIDLPVEPALQLQQRTLAP